MQKVRKAKRKRLEHRDIQSPRRDKAAPAEDSIRPMKNDKFPNKMRLLTINVVDLGARATVPLCHCGTVCVTVPRNMTMIVSDKTHRPGRGEKCWRKLVFPLRVPAQSRPLF